jgi:triosephosphate isomerase
MRRRLAAGNWKMNGTAAASPRSRRLAGRICRPVEILLPPATLLAQMA